MLSSSKPLSEQKLTQVFISLYGITKSQWVGLEKSPLMSYQELTAKLPCPHCWCDTYALCSQYKDPILSPISNYIVQKIWQKHNNTEYFCQILPSHSEEIPWMAHSQYIEYFLWVHDVSSFFLLHWFNSSRHHVYTCWLGSSPVENNSYLVPMLN